jgi:AAA ATPase domain
MAGRQDSPLGTRALNAWDFFVGRERELDELQGALNEARSGRGRFVLLAGESGIGKTALACVLAERAAEDGVRVVWGRCWEGGGAPPFWPWGRIVDDLCHERDGRWTERELGPEARRLGLIAPELGERLDSHEGAATGEPDQARFALLSSLATFLRAASANGPLLLLVDDVDVAGTDALLALEFVSRELRDAPVLGVATYKEHAIRTRPEAEAIVSGLASACRRIVLTGVSESDLALMIEQITGVRPDQDLVQTVNALSAGNPFFAAEIVRTLASEGELEGDLGVSAIQLPLPSGVRDAVARRIASLPDVAREVLSAAAVIGRQFRVATVQRAGAVEREELLEAIDQALAAGLIEPRPPAATEFRFSHGLIRETIYADLGTAERGRLHRAVGEAMEQIYAGELDGRLSELAHHFFEAAVGGDPAKAVDYALRAGRRASRVLAWEEAARLFGQGLAALELEGPDPARRAELLVELGRAEVHAGAPSARETLRTAAGAAAAAAHPDLLARAALDFGAFALSPGIVDDELVALLDQALAALDPSDSPARVRLLARLGVALYWSPEEERRLQVADEAVAMARRLDDRAALAYALANRQGATSSPDRTEDSVRTAVELFRLSESAGDLELELPARVRQIAYLLELDDLAGADVALETLARLASESGDPRAKAYLPLERSRRLAMEGSFEDAERLNAEAASLGAELRDSTIPLQAGAQLIGMRWMQGRIREMLPQLKRFADGYPAMPAFRAALAVAYCEADCRTDAQRELRVLASRDFEGIPRDSLWLLATAFISETCAYLADAVHAELLYPLLAPFDGRNVVSPNAIFAGPVSRYLGLLCAAQEDWETAEGHLDGAWEQANLDGSRPLMARTRLDHARVLLARGEEADRARAIVLLDEAEALAGEIELPVLVEWVAAARPKEAPAAPEPVDSASAAMRREGEVWRLDYDGRVIHVRDSKGVRHLAVLLASPGVELPAGEVEVRADGASVAGEAAAAEAGLAVQASADAALAGLDATAKREYRQRLEDLREEIEQAEAWSDPERAARAREELDLIGSQLSAAVGLGGRDRPLASGAERARLRVTRAIHTAIRRVGEQDEALGYELRATVRTGSFCSYEPDPRRPVSWRIEAD